jgi:Domain of unknown function (DUF4157)
MPYLSRSKTSERKQQKDTEYNSSESVRRSIPLGPAFDILNLQRMVGNQAVTHVLQSGRYSYQTSKNIDPPIVHEVLSSPGQPLDVGTRAFMEPRFGHDFSHMRVHADAQAAESARSVNALAYTVGQHVVFGAGQYEPETSKGKRLLAHELTHVVQQQGVDATTLHKEQITVASPQSNLEVEANRNAASITGNQSASIHPSTTTVQIMKQPAGSEPPQRASAQVSSSGGVPGRTRKQIRRDNFLRGLAARPDFALDSWKRLGPDEQTAVVAYMAEFYGLNFARRFQSATLKLPHREDLIVTWTNNPDYTPERLTASGYKLFSADPIQHWVHPSGKEVWVSPPSKGEPQQALPPEDPAVTEARGHAEDFATERDHIVDLGKQLRNHIGKPDYQQLYRQFWDKFEKWQHDLNWIREVVLPDLKDLVGSQDQQALEQQVKRLDDLFEWKSSGFPDLVRDLPPP